MDHLEKRYELCAGLSSNKNIIVFGGANKTENLNSTQIIDTGIPLLLCCGVFFFGHGLQVDWIGMV